MPVFIQQIATALPNHRYSIGEISHFLSETAINATSSRKGAIVARKSGIEQRYSVLEDFRLGERRELFNGHLPMVEERMKVYDKHALPLALEAVSKLDFNPEEITHIITVSCTGMTAPGLELQLVNALNLPSDCTKLAVNFIGCHGVFHALKTAQSFAAHGPKVKVLVVSVELCSLHFQPSDNDDSILANVLFGDGAAACIISNEISDKAIRLDDFKQFYLPDNDRAMAWNIHSSGFKLALSSYVPKILKSGIHQISGDTSNPDLQWAVHPGGKNILDAIEDGLDLPSEKLDHSRAVLRSVGNLSSATILFVLKRILYDAATSAPLCALGFGPGLTIEQLIGEIVVE